MTNRVDWRNLESNDYRAYIANLRAVGCPEETVRDIIIADVEKLFASRTRASARQRTPNFWEPENRDLTTFLPAEEKWRQEQALNSQKRALLKELLGIDIELERRRSAGEEDVLDRRLQFLPDGKRQQVRDVLDKYEEMERAFQEEATRVGAVGGDDYRAQLKELAASRRAELAGLLSPQQLELYHLWTSDAAVATRDMLVGFDSPSEADFRAIYNLRRQLDGQFDSAHPDLSDPATREKWERASAEMEQQLRLQLGEQRYAEYQRSQDHNYRELVELSRHYNLPAETARKVYEMKQALAEQTESILGNTTLDETSKADAISANLNKVSTSVRQMLGESGFNYYVQQGNGAWLTGQ